MIEGKKLLVFSAHAADYVWRSGGTIAKYVEGGAEVHVVAISLGIRGESDDLWKKEGQTEESVRATRRAETMAAAETLGIRNFEIWDFQDYPLYMTPERDEMVLRKIREVRPDYIITHDTFDIMNPDHDAVHKSVFAGASQSSRRGVQVLGTTVNRQPALYGFEPHQTELSNFKPAIFVDITQTYEKKVKAMECFQAQKHLIEIYKQRAFLRGNHARRISGDRSIKYAECFAASYPVVSGELL